jgi:hypothetical protein
VDIQEGSRKVWRDGAFVPGAPGIEDASDAGEWIRFEVGAGSYSFKLIGGEGR